MTEIVKNGQKIKMFDESDMKTRGDGVTKVSSTIDKEGYSGRHTEYTGESPHDFWLKGKGVVEITNNPNLEHCRSYSWKGLVMNLVDVVRLERKLLQEEFVDMLLKVNGVGKQICFSYDPDRFKVVNCETDIWMVKGTDGLLACTKRRADVLVELCYKIVNASGYSDGDLKIRTFEQMVKADKKAREEADKKAREESRKLKHFNEYKKRLKEYDLQKKYDAFKTMLKEKAVEDLKKTREGFDSVNIAKEDDIVHSAGQSIGDVEQQSKQMIEDAKQCVRQMIEDAKLPKNIESEKIHAKELEEKNQVLLNKNKEKDDEVLKTESEKMRTKEKSRIKNVEYHKHNAADNTIIGAGLLTNIFEIISCLSKENKKCNNMILVNNFYKKGYKNYEIYSALNLMEKENIIYKIIYVDWFIKERYRDNDIDATNKLWIDIFKIIKDFSKKYNWKYGIKRSDLYDELLKKDHLEADIGLALESMKKQDIIYNKTYIYWFTNEYKGHIKEEITEEEVAEEDIIEFPRHAEDPKVEVPKTIIDTTALQTKVTTLESQNTALQTKVTTLESQNTALQTKVTTLESQIDEKIKRLNEEEENFRSAEHRYDDARQSHIKLMNELYNAIREGVRIPSQHRVWTLRSPIATGNRDIKLMNEFYNAIREGVRIPSQHRVWTLRSPIATGNRDIIESEQKKANNAGFLTEIVEIIMVEKKSK